MAIQSADSKSLDPSFSSKGRLNLLAVLDWGLGHASRSLALADRLRQSGERICWASAGQSLAMIKRETRGEMCYELPPYGIRYPTRFMSWNMLIQSGQIFGAIRKEKLATEKILLDSGAERLISDSRFGCHSGRVPSIFLSHQLQPIVPRAIGWLYRLWIKSFDAYWVPDYAHENRLSGRLSHGSKLEKIYFLGYLSRLEKEPEHSSRKVDEDRRWQVCVLLSGPEPQRTKLEIELIGILAMLPGQHWLIRGLPEGSEIVVPENVRLTHYADKLELIAAIENSSLLICRSGYSTLMDLGVVDRPEVLLVPTPGQTEQIYLAERLAEMGWASCARQGRISLKMIKDLLAFS